MTGLYVDSNQSHITNALWDAEGCGLDYITSSERFYAYIRTGVGSWRAVDQLGITHSNWYSVSMVYENNRIYLYVDGEYIDDASDTMLPLDRVLYIGYDDDNVWYYTGKIDEFRVYSRGLNSEEIKAVYYEGQ